MPITFECGCSHHVIAYRGALGAPRPAPVYLVCAKHADEVKRLRRQRWEAEAIEEEARATALPPPEGWA